MSLSLFQPFLKDQFLEIFHSSKYTIDKYDRGQIIHLQNEQCHGMDILLEGKVSVQKIEEDGNILKISVFSGGDVFGANLMFSSRNAYPMTVVSESKSIILHIPKELTLKLSQNNPDFMARLLRVISDKTLVLSDKINAISLKTIRQRIMDYLKYEYHLQRSNIISLNISKKELAERLGVQRSSLGRELNKMRRDGLIEYDAKTIIIKSLNGL